MKNSIITRFFLGANSGAGFASLYDGFASGADDFLWIIKGGPGGGKSGFMKRIGSAAESNGFDVEYICCSGDPDSLDGVYLPQLHTGWADGTSPHILDPAVFGASGAYLDLGAFCNCSACSAVREQTEALSKRCAEEYARAYSLLKAAAACSPEHIPGLVSEREAQAAVRRAASAADIELPKGARGASPAKVTRRFLSAVAHKGKICLEDTVSALCKRVYLLDNRYGLARFYLAEILRQANARGADCILCPSPLTPEQPEAVLFPRLSLAFVSSDVSMPNTCAYRHVRLDALPDADTLRSLRRRFRRESGIRDALLESAVAALAEAKAIHDELEALYRPYVDFDAVFALAQSEAGKVLETNTPRGDDSP